MPIPREATVILGHEGATYEAIVDIAAKAMRSFNKVDGVQAPFVASEFYEVGELVKNDPRVRAALAKRGITDLATVVCETDPAGYVGLPEQNGRRTAWSICANTHGVYRGNGRPIEGVYAVVDLGAHKVLRVDDSGVVPVPADPVDFDEQPTTPRPGTTPITVTQPLGPAFQITDGDVAWQRWHFRFRIDPRVGLVLNLVRYDDGTRLRSIMYEGSLSEIFVPYMDPDEVWASHVYIDAGEYLLGGLVKPLREGVDCPSNAVFVNAVVPSERGTPILRARVACLFERAGGQIAWRHGRESDYDQMDVAGRPARDLVLRTAAVVGNYDYVFDWNFKQDGSIHVGVGATGIIEVKGVPSRVASTGASKPIGSAPAAAAASPDEYGHLVAENTVGVNHDHFFSFRLDLDVDGPNNSLVVDRLTPKRLPASNPYRKSLWVVVPTTAHTERDGIQDLSMEQPTLWRIINPDAHGPLGYPTGYEIVPGMTGTTMLSPDDWPQKRAAFSAHSLWITPYKRDELYAAGVYATNSKGDDGLATWTRANRVIENTDIVAWYTMGFHHVTRAEDWPVMPTLWHEFVIRPYDFFPRNPELDLPLTP
jgi:primary-amine oxidase